MTRYTSEDLSRLVRELRIKAGDTQAALGKKLQPPVTRAAISQAEDPTSYQCSSLDGLKERVIEHYTKQVLRRVYELVPAPQKSTGKSKSA